MFAAVRRGVTFSNVVALLALFVALGGTAYAVKKLNGRDIVANSIPGTKLKRDTLGGREINEAKLGTVPSAANAANAVNAIQAQKANEANVASSLGGKTAADFAPAGLVQSSGLVKLAVGQEQTLIAKGPFTVRVVCAAAGGGNTEVKLLLRTTEVGSLNFANEIPPNTDVLLGSASVPPGSKGGTSQSSLRLLAPSGTAIEASVMGAVGILGVPCAGSGNSIG